MKVRLMTQVQFCVDILLDKVKQDVKYRNRLIADGFYSDYTFLKLI